LPTQLQIILLNTNMQTRRKPVWSRSIDKSLKLQEMSSIPTSLMNRNHNVLHTYRPLLATYPLALSTCQVLSSTATGFWTRICFWSHGLLWILFTSKQEHVRSLLNRVEKEPHTL
jgi:hypothetical protein